MLTKPELLRNVYMKLDGMVLSFGLPKYSEDITDAEVERYLGIDYTDARREFGIPSDQNINITIIDDALEYVFENRILYHSLRRFRLSASVYFKFSTATDGKTVDKSMIPKMLNDIIKELNDEYKKWKGSHTSISGLWTMTSTVATNGDS